MHEKFWSSMLLYTHLSIFDLNSLKKWFQDIYLSKKNFLREWGINVLFDQSRADCILHKKVNIFLVGNIESRFALVRDQSLNVCSALAEIITVCYLYKAFMKIGEMMHGLLHFVFVLFITGI